jgi:hypothetical protein
MWLSVGWFLPYFEMSWCGGPHFSYCGWWVGAACDRWWLFSLLYLLCLGHMHFNLLCCLSGLCLSCGVSKLNWWNIVFSTSGGVGISSWIWRLLCFALGSGGVWSFALRNLVSWLVLSWVWNLMSATRMAWFEGGGLWFALVWGWVGALVCILYILLIYYIFFILT